MISWIFIESFHPVNRDRRVMEREESKEGSGEVRSTVEMLLADWEEVMNTEGRSFLLWLK